MPLYRLGTSTALLPIKDSNLDYLIQNQASCQLDESGVVYDSVPSGSLSR